MGRIFYRQKEDRKACLESDRNERQEKMTEEARKALIKAQQGELDGVETYLMLAEVVHNEDDVKAFKELAADEGKLLQNDAAYRIKEAGDTAIL